MKIRSDFVTNSSSSSFVLSFKDRASVESTIRDQFPEEIECDWHTHDEYLSQLIEDVRDPSHICTFQEMKEEVIDELSYPAWRQAVSKVQSEMKVSYEEACSYVHSTKEGRKLQIDILFQMWEDASEKFKDDTVFAIIDHGSSGDGEDGVLERKVLPNLPCTQFVFSHH